LAAIDEHAEAQRESCK
jgi:hypothetical protein